MYQLTRFFLAKRVALCLKEACRSLSIDQAIDSSIDWSWSSVSAAWTCEYVFLSLRIMCCCLFFPCVFLSRNETTTAAAALQSMNKNWKKKERKISFRWIVIVTIAELASEWSIDRSIDCKHTHRTTITIAIKWELVAWVFVHFKCLSFFIINDQWSSSPSREHTHL